MDSRRKQKRKVEEISFVLHNIFIIHPNATSKYKIRIIVNRNNKEQPFRKVSNRYIFRVPSNIEQMKGKVCYLVLLQKAKKNGVQAQYSQIGKGQIQLAQIIQNRDLKKQSMVSGVIYGTRSFNYDKIIGKYGYKAMKTEGLADNNKEQGTIKKNIFNHHTRISKPIPISSQESIVKQNNEINNKIKELTSSMNKIISPEPMSQYENDNDMFRDLAPIKEAIFQQCQFYYKYNAKIYDELNGGLNFKQFKTMIIRNIRIDSKQFESQSLKMLDTIKVQKFNKKLSPPKKKLTGNIEQILIVCYQLFQQKRQRKRLLEIYTGINYNRDNRFLVDHIFYLPKTNNKLLFEVILVQYNNKERNLSGIVEPSVAKSRLIELLDTQNKQKGIIICQLQNCTEIDKGQIKGYIKQSQKFDRALRRYSDVSHFATKKVPPPFKEELVKEIKTLDKNRDTLYSNFHDGQKSSPLKRKRYNTQLGQSSHLINSSISRSKYSMSIASDKDSVDLSSRKGLKLLSKSIRAFPTESQSEVKFHKSPKKHHKIGEDFSGRYRLAIEAAQISIYGLNMKNKKLLAKFEMNDQNKNKKLVLNSQNDWHPLDLSFDHNSANDSLMISLLLNKRNTTTYKNVGGSNILVNQLKNYRSNTYKAFISNDNKVVGFVILAFKVFREREDDQKSQSFYYEQEFNRDIPLVNDEKKYLEQRFQDDSYLDFNEISQREKNQHEYNIDQEPKHISPANNTQMHYISQKMSQGPPSEVLEDQDYNDGEPIRRRF